ncbi:hypothetical protein ACQEVX_04595 [Streptomyces syringium]|uniref:hypothetical protein n=1 Tax=Streptomyces syringium TaxID=76729 RepID=UPI003D948676
METGISPGIRSSIRVSGSPPRFAQFDGSQPGRVCSPVTSRSSFRRLSTGTAISSARRRSVVSDAGIASTKEK